MSLVVWYMIGGIESKFYIIVDNASINNTFVGSLQNHLNMKKFLEAKGICLYKKCCAHIINIIFQRWLHFRKLLVCFLV